MDEPPLIGIGLRLEGSESLIHALDGQVRACELAKTLAQDRDRLERKIADLRFRYSALLHALMEHMRLELVAAHWQEVRPGVWLSPENKRYQGTELAWRTLRGLDLFDAEPD